MASTQVEQFWQDLVGDIRANRLVLPALPDVAIRTRRLLDNPKSASNQVARAISADAVLTTRLLRVVNSPLYRTRHQIDDIRTAVTRLGNANVRSMVTSLAMEQIYQNKLASPFKRRYLARSWEHGIMVAALSYVISDRYTGLNPDEAMLAGLIHDIGKLPIIEYSEMLSDFSENEQRLDRLLEALHPRVGALVLRAWKFAPEMVAVAAEHEDLQRAPETDTDYTDVVIVANLLSHVGTDHPHTRLDWSTIPAFERLALTPEESIDVMKNAREQINEIKRLLAG
jgi:putative nucleotidyltransferase with HDIG domain